MAKYLINPLELVVAFSVDGATVTLDLSAHYGIGCDGIEMRKSIDIVLTPAQEAQIKDFAKNVVLPQIKTNEGI